MFQSGLQLKDLIERGYLPYELIPPISTKDFAEVTPKIATKIESFTGEKHSKYCTLTIPKVKHVRRILAIPNPYHQLNLSKLLVKHWENIHEYIYKSPISLSKPVVDNLTYLGEKSERAFSREINLSEIAKKRAILSTDSKYLLKADISRFYPTIYTHSIPWAIHSKKVVKSNLKERNNKNKKNQKLYGEFIDDYVRFTQENQTLGIPIGPDSSMIISEIIGTAIDLELQSKLKERKIKLKGLRFVDDFYLYFNNLNDAEFALSVLHVIMKDFELELNSEKTTIIELPDILEPMWVLELRKMHNKKNGKIDLHDDDDLIGYFSKAFDLSKQYPDEPVLKYALSEIADLTVGRKDWEIYESLLLNSMYVEPSVLPIATEIFLGYKLEKYKLNKKKISSTLFEILSYHCQFGNTHEITWALWLCKTLNIKLPVRISKELSKIDDSIVALVSLDLFYNGNIKKLDTTLWESLLNKEELYNKNWLLVYESVMKGWLNPKENILETDPFFKLLKENNIQFYKSNEQVNPILVKPKPADVLEAIQRRRRKRFY